MYISTNITNKMLLYRISSAYQTGDWVSAKTLMWVFTQINFKKLFYRVRYARNTGWSTKCVLLEYAHTSNLRRNNMRVEQMIPGTSVSVHNALARPEFQVLLNKVLGDDGDNIIFYTRQKINPDNTPNYGRRQLVVVFYPYAFRYYDGRPAEEEEHDDIPDHQPEIEN